MPVYLLYAFGSAVAAGFVAIFAKLGLKNIDSSLATTIRAIFMAVLLTIFILVFNRTSLSNIKDIEVKDWVLIALSGVAGAVSWLFYFFALKESGNDTVKVAAIDKLSVVFVLVFSILVLKDKVDLPTIVGVTLIVIGGIVLTLKF
ncbi:MAG: EamA family transporter [Candidatus Dojkabacteria bacterium]